MSVLWPAWEWIRFPERRLLYSSYAAPLSIRDSVKCRTLIESPWYQGRWGDRFSLTGDQNTKAGSRTTAPVIGCRHIGGRRGHRRRRRPGRLRRSAQRPGSRIGFGSQRRRSTGGTSSMSTRVNDPRTAAKVVVMQRCHQRDLSGHLLEQGGWEHLCLPAEYEGAGRSRHRSAGPIRARSRANCCGRERFGPKEIAELKLSLGSYAAAGQLQQRPSPAGGGIFKRHWFRYYQPRGANLPPVSSGCRMARRCRSLRSKCRTGRRADPVLGLLVQGSGYVGLRRRPGVGATGAAISCWAIRFAPAWTAPPR